MVWFATQYKAYLVIFFFLFGLMAQVSASDQPEIRGYVTQCIAFRDAVTESLTEIDNQAAYAALHLADPKTTDDTIMSLLSSLHAVNNAVDGAAFITPDGNISQVSDSSFAFLLGSHVPDDFFKDAPVIPFITHQSLFIRPSEQTMNITSGRDLIWPVRTDGEISHLAIHINSYNLGELSAKKAGLHPEIFSVLMDHNGDVLWCSDYREFHSVPPDNVLTEVPTFRDVQELVRYSWTGRTIYEVWNSHELFRTGAWSAFQMYNEVFRVFVAQKNP